MVREPRLFLIKNVLDPVSPSEKATCTALTRALTGPKTQRFPPTADISFERYRFILCPKQNWN